MRSLKVIDRDLHRYHPPFPESDFADSGSAERSGSSTISDMLIAEVEAADVLLITTPMHNFSIPAALKAWIDQVLRPGRTFETSANGKVGLLSDRPAFAVITCGGQVSDDDCAQPDYLWPYLRYVLSVIGLRSARSLRLDRLHRGQACVDEANARANTWIAEVVRDLDQAWN